jgi:hypothetical protein
MTTSQPPSSQLPIRIAQTLGITLSTFVAGSSITISTFLVPRLLESPAPLLLSQWTNLFHAGKVTAPPLSLISACTYFYLSYTKHTSYLYTGTGRDRFAVWSYLVAGLLSVGIIPYTLLVMGDTNRKLLQQRQSLDYTRELNIKEDEITQQYKDNKTVHELVDWWGVLNLGRGLMLTISGVLGTWVALG